MNRSDHYILGIDQSTQGTKALLLDQDGNLICRADLPHRQIINDKGWVEHDPVEIYENTIKTVRMVVEKAGIDKNAIAAVGISNQRETAVVWDRESNKPVYHAIVWQCARGELICREIADQGHEALIRERTGLQLSPYFTAAKIAWILRHVPEAGKRAVQGKLCCGTMDSWLIYQLTKGKSFFTDYSNASRTQMFGIRDLAWDEDVLSLFGIPVSCLAEVLDSDACYGETDFNGFLDRPVRIHGCLGDSHGALLGQGCLKPGMIKATYGTGSSVMMNIGEQLVLTDSVVTSLAWSLSGHVQYVLEGNINYTGAVISWLKDDLQLIQSPGETQDMARAANPDDRTYLVPAFTGLGAPYWDSQASASISGISRRTGKNEIVRAALDCIVYQITDVVEAMKQAADLRIEEIRVDGGPTRNQYLMQFQSDMLSIPLKVPQAEELSGIGAAFAAGLGIGFYQKETLFTRMEGTMFTPSMNKDVREEKYMGWKEAVGKVLSHS